MRLRTDRNAAGIDDRSGNDDFHDCRRYGGRFLDRGSGNHDNCADNRSDNCSNNDCRTDDNGSADDHDRRSSYNDGGNDKASHN